MGHRGPAELEVQGPEHGHLHVQDILLAVGVVRDVHKVLDLGRVDLLELGGNEHGGHTAELELPPGHLPMRQVPVSEVHRHEQRLRPQAVLPRNLHKPINKNPPHLRVDLTLLCHIVWPGLEERLHRLHVRVYIFDVLSHMLGVLHGLVQDVLTEAGIPHRAGGTGEPRPARIPARVSARVPPGGASVHQAWPGEGVGDISEHATAVHCETREASGHLTEP
mmetsp:Transcript_31396/g.74897  ORF Transcript_31396/g.74897 Transcript_31396/m.74897 type:complete len:221 (+) Transcript_31396:417-1079(+)